MVEFDPRDDPSAYEGLVNRLLFQPLTWVSTRGNEGADHLTPFGFTGVVSFSPPIIALSTVGAGFNDKEDDTTIKFDSDVATSDTYTTEEFVVNFPTQSTINKIYNAIQHHGPSSDLFQANMIERRPAQTVTPPRLAGASIVLECGFRDEIVFGESSLLFGDIVQVATNGDIAREKVVAAEEFLSSDDTE